MITYPIDMSDATIRFTFRQALVTERNKRWVVSDGGPIPNPPADLVIMQEFRTQDTINPDTQKLDDGAWIDDEVNQTTTFHKSAIPLTQAELDAIAKRNTLAGFADEAKAFISALESKSIQYESNDPSNNAQMLTAVNLILDDLSVFFDRHAKFLRHYFRDLT